MARDPMHLLRTLRQMAVEEARQALGACLKAESDAAERVKAFDDVAQRDREAHKAVEHAYRFEDMFARRHGELQAARRGAEKDLAAARTRSAAARAAVAAVRTEAEAVDTLIGERAAAVEVVASRADQHAMDDMARVRVDSAPRHPRAKEH